MTDQLERIYRRLMMLVGRGRVKVVDDTGPVQLVQIKLGADEVRDGTPRLAEYGLTSNPPPGSDAVAVCLSGDRSTSVIIATGNQAYRLHLAPGEAALHDMWGRKVLLSQAGMVLDGGGQNIAIQNAPQVTVTGGDVIADGISLKTHVHGGVSTGSGNTGAPHA